MSRAIAEHSLFKPKPSKAESKADVTNHAARTIVEADAARREAKTARLRQARLENEAKLAAESPPAKPQKSKAAKQQARSSS